MQNIILQYIQDLFLHNYVKILSKLQECSNEEKAFGAKKELYQHRVVYFLSGFKI